MTIGIQSVHGESLTPTQGATQQSGKKRGATSEVDLSHLPSRGPTSGRKCYVTPAFSGIPKTKGDKIKSGYHNPAFSGAPKRAETLRHPCILGAPS